MIILLNGIDGNAHKNALDVPSVTATGASRMDLSRIGAILEEIYRLRMTAWRYRAILMGQ